MPGRPPRSDPFRDHAAEGSATGELALRALGGGSLAVVIALLALRARALSPSGALAAVVLGTVTMTAGWSWGALLIAFFVSSTLIGRIGSRRRSRRIGGIVAKGGHRDAWQVLANGGVFAAAAAGHLLAPAVWWQVIGCGALATVAGDTWGTEIGSLARSDPRLVTTWERVPAGTSGGVSLWGTIASVAGAAFVGGVAALAAWPSGPVLASVAGGIAGSFADSLLGATLQARRWCGACGTGTEQPVHVCGEETRLIGGWARLDNDAVNLVSAIIGATAAVGISVLVGDPRT